MSNQSQRCPLDRAAIVEAALAILDEKGVDGLSMRRIARRLQAAPMSLYRHVRDKHELMELVTEAVAERLPVLDHAESWEDSVRTVFRAIRRLLLDHPGIAAFLSGDVTLTPSVMQAVDGVLGALERGGFDDREAARTVAALWVVTLGSTLAEQAVVARHQDPAGHRSDFALRAAERAAEGHPHIARAAPHWAEADEETAFEHAMDLIIVGLRQRRGGRGTAGGPATG